ncbi:hypothetical protein [Photobacterium damselae]|uniref:hypothetical protein n=1 Tax=Photobacterium damselae TaxID=38293 RepID=UPI001F2188D4|nr:hypothetical protein [Photobacterium damselae]UKA04744.1 hypothetical protein IHC89_21115 [Photobacterium damselae subsp. damselae]
MKHFIFFNENDNERTLRMKARSLRNKNTNLSFMDALNKASYEINNGVAFNKAVAKMKSLSPFTVLANEEPELKHDTLFLPIEVNADVHGVECDAIYYVPVTNKCAALSRDCKISLEENDDFIQKLQWRNLERINNGTVTGWVVNFYQPHTNEFVANIELKCTHDGIILELWSESCGEFIDSTIIEYTDLFEIGSFEEITKSNKSISDYEACVELGFEEDSTTTLLTAGGLELTLSGCWVVDDGDGSYITPNQLHSLFTDTEQKEFMNWLQGKYNEMFSDFECISTPWFSITNEDTLTCEVFDTIPRNLNGCLYLMAMQFIN